MLLAGLALVAVAVVLTACAAQRSAPSPDEPATRPSVRGVVVDVQGRGHAGARIEVPNARTEAFAVTSLDGRFVLRAALPGYDDYPLAVTIPDAGPGTTFFANRATGPDRDIRIVADPTLRMRGVVRPPPDPARYVETLLVRGGGTSRQEDTARDGTFDVAWLAPGVTYTFSVWRGGVGWREVGVGRTGATDIVLDAP